jgi:O-antigen/teichoic acid export membrane protein
MATRDERQDTRDIVRGTFVNFIGMAMRGLNFAFFIVLGRLYGPNVTGVFLLALATVVMLSNLSIFGLNRAVLMLAARRYIDGDMDGVYRTIGQALRLGLAMALTVLVGLELLAPWLATTLFDKPSLVQPWRIMACALPCWTISAILLFATRALRIMKYEVITKGGVEPAVTLALALTVSAVDGGLVGLGVAVLASALVGMLTAVYFFSRELSLTRLGRACWTTRGQQQLYSLAAPIGLHELLAEFFKRTDLFLVGRYLSTDLLGVYSIVQEAAVPIKKIRQAFDPICIPVFAAAHQKRDRDNMLHQYQNVTRWILILDAGFVIGVVLAGRSLMGLFGADFVIGSVTVALLTLALAINGVLGVAEILLLIDKPWVNLVNTLAATVVNVVLNLLLIPRYGIIGAALASLISQVMMNIGRLIAVALLHRLQPLTQYHAKATTACFAALAPVWGIRTAAGGEQGVMADIGAAVACWLLYFILLRAFGLAPEDKEALNRWRKWMGRRRPNVNAA